MGSLFMNPSCGGSLVRYVGDALQFTINNVPNGHRAFLRTNIGRARELRQGVIRSIQEPKIQLETGWRDVPMSKVDGEWEVVFALSEVGWFQSKAYTCDAEGGQFGPILKVLSIKLPFKHRGIYGQLSVST